MQSSPEPRPYSRRARILPVVLIVPLIAAVFIAYVATSEGSQGGRLPVAAGSIGVNLHPLAGNFVPDDTSLGDCHGQPTCLEQAFGNMSFRDGPRPALALFADRIEADPDVEKDCHRIAHTIGSAALARFGGNVAKTFAAGSPTCVSGYYHGILERAFLGISSKLELRRAARTICTGGGMRRRGFLDYQCRHGLGHGLMLQTGYDLPLSLSICAGLGTGWDNKACAGGVFMENLDTRFGFRSAWLDDRRPTYPCTEVAARDRRSCYLRASWRIYTLNGRDAEATVAACERLGAWKRACLNGYGRDAAELARFAPDKILRRCALAGAGESDCLVGAARTIANASGAPGITPAAALCRDAPLESRGPCLSGVGLVMGMLYPTAAARRDACSAVARQYASRCTTAANAEVEPSGAHSWG